MIIGCPRFQDPEDSPQQGQQEERLIKTSGKTVIVAYKPSKANMAKIMDEIKEALLDQNVEKITDSLKQLERARRDAPKTPKEAPQSNDDEQEAYKGEEQIERSNSKIENLWEKFAKKMIEVTPDPVVTSQGHSMSYKNLTLLGLSDAHLCKKAKLKKAFNMWKGYICMASLTSTVDSVTGPGVPFKGRVAGIFKNPKVEFRY